MQNNQNKKEMVNHPDHYNKGNPAYEPYKVIREWGCNFNIGSAIKYLSRYKNKWNPIEDLEKAIKYIEFEISAIKENSEENSADEYSEPDEYSNQDEINKAIEELDEELNESKEDQDEDTQERISTMRECLEMSDDDILRVLGLDSRQNKKFEDRVARRIREYIGGTSEPPSTRFTRANF